MKILIALLILAAGLEAQIVTNGASPTDMPGQVSVSTAWLYWNKMHYAGAWSGSATYNSQDLVLYNGASYISLQPGNANNTPGITPTWWVALSVSGQGLPTGTYCVSVTSGIISGLTPCSGGGVQNLSWANLTNAQWIAANNAQWLNMTN